MDKQITLPEPDGNTANQATEYIGKVENIQKQRTTEKRRLKYTRGINALCGILGTEEGLHNQGEGAF